jgi:hypothetical protein
MKEQSSRPSRRTWAGAVASGLALCTAMGIGTGVSAASPHANASSKPIVVWVDSARLAMVHAWQQANPSVKLDVVTFDGGSGGDGSIQSMVGLSNRTGHGWPDIVFSENANDVQSLGQAPFNFPATLNNGLVSNAILNNFTTGVNDPCMIGKKLECLRNDLGFDVLWVNVPLMKQFGYTIPTTWQQWQAIGEDVAKHHPGYIIGEQGVPWDEDIYLQPAQCHLNDVVAPFVVESNPKDPNCTNMTKLLDPLLKDGSVPIANDFGSTFAKQYGGKVLLTVGPAYDSRAIFEGPGSALNSPKGTYEAAAPLKWAGAKQTWTGNVGGGLWILSSHSSQLAAAAKVMVGLATSTVSQDQSQGYPGYAPAAKSWIAIQDKSGLFARPLAPVFAAAAPLIWPGWSQTPWNVFSLWGQNVVPNLVSGSTVTSQLSVMATAIADNAQNYGYQVKG